MGHPVHLLGEDSIGEGLLSIGCIPAAADDDGSAAANRISVDTSATRQTVEGFGASLTAASAWVIWRHPDREQARERYLT